MKPLGVNHGNVFNTGSWWTFYCPQCKQTITRKETEKKGCQCGCQITWPEVIKV